eukprot:CAMPEP_0202898624 /NCGR_PEP_ID=MMETSP1392-20130828/7103_1 /ASSEMBLY_ACC=CAM_ASM_000868 /TAXON_ID=225041 /ORGANISM="Chlamydomonas chlamydogama, Strain SAG 11-48b" /LENGTH=255 /DNA_ID=CAMNT_0049584609 /DNA_START=260 /DNA_END=1024 /DNA_ORIENTATION=-
MEEVTDVEPSSLAGSFPGSVWNCIGLALADVADVQSLLLTCKGAAGALGSNPAFASDWLISHPTSDALLCAARANMSETCQQLLTRCLEAGNVAYSAEAARSALWHAAKQGDEEVCALLIPHCDATQLCPLQLPHGIPNSYSSARSAVWPGGNMLVAAAASVNMSKVCNLLLDVMLPQMRIQWRVIMLAEALVSVCEYDAAYRCRTSLYRERRRLANRFEEHLEAATQEYELMASNTPGLVTEEEFIVTIAESLW